MEVKVLDNCVGQNKSNTMHKFSMLSSLLYYPDGVTDIYFRVGHSHNTSDLKTAHAKKALEKKNLYTTFELAIEIGKVKGLYPKLLQTKDTIFNNWSNFLNSYFDNMQKGLTKCYIF